jgi:hypothetical protein
MQKDLSLKAAKPKIIISSITDGSVQPLGSGFLRLEGTAVQQSGLLVS